MSGAKIKARTAVGAALVMPCLIITWETLQGARHLEGHRRSRLDDGHGEHLDPETETCCCEEYVRRRGDFLQVPGCEQAMALEVAPRQDETRGSCRSEVILRLPEAKAAVL